MLARWKDRARKLKREVYALYLAYRDPRVPRHARIFAGCVVIYALSPLDLIPDFIPVVGYLDDLVLVPLGIALALRMIPADVLADCRAEAQRLIEQGRPVSRLGAALMIAVWLLAVALIIWLVVRIVR
ncbi:MAG: YkvA family protein [Thermomicrobiales bacterium]